MADPAEVKAKLRSAFRDFRVDGVPASGANEPIKAEAREGFSDLVDLAALSTVTKAVATRAALSSIPSPAVGDSARVTADPLGDVVNGNGVWSWTGTAWQWIGTWDSTSIYADRGSPGIVDLNTIQGIGVYMQTNTSNATLLRNYPWAGVGIVLEVNATAFSSQVLQRATSLENGVNRSVTRRYNGSTWSAWTAETPPGLAESYKDEGLLGAVDLNTVLTKGVYIQNSQANATLERNYPWAGISLVLEVVKTANSSLLLQRATSLENGVKRTASRRYTGSVWNPWAFEQSADIAQSVKDRITARGEWFSSDDVAVVFDTVARTLTWNRTITLPTKAAAGGRLNIAPFSLDLSGAPDFAVVYVDLAALPNSTVTVSDPTPFIKYAALPVWVDGIDTIPIAKIRAVTGKAIACAGFFPIANTGAEPEPSGDAASLTFAFEKLAKSLTVYKQGAGANRIRTQLIRTTMPAINLDNWGMGQAQEVIGQTNGVQRNLTSNGVWECALKDAANPEDHSGGAHGDELRSDAFFLIDGVLYAEDSVVSGRASEIKFIQRSSIYVEGDPLTKIADRLCEWTWLPGDQYRLRQTLTPVAGRSFTSTFGLGMCPVLRKANADNTGAQITDTEVRSQDWVRIDASEPGFERRVLPITAGDAITLSSTASGLSATMSVNAITSPDPHAFVQNNIQFNKIYLAATDPDATHVVQPDEEWSVDVTYTLSTRN